MLTLLEEGEPLRADMVLLALGVTPDTKLAENAGLDLGVGGSIAVNDRMETSAPDIYAVGDAVEVRQFVTGQKTLISLAGPANKQGRIAADNICGGDSRFHGAQASSVLKLFDMTAASTGINEKTAQAEELDYDKVVLFPPAHASYYPGATPLYIKALYEKGTLRLLGAQIVGREGVDKRIDVLATAILSWDDGDAAQGAGPGLCAALCLCQGPGEFHRLPDRKPGPGEGTAVPLA